MSTNDRANVVVTAILQTIRQALERDPDLRAALVELLADEIDGAVRQAIHEVRREDG